MAGGYGQNSHRRVNQWFATRSTWLDTHTHRRTLVHIYIYTHIFIVMHNIDIDTICHRCCKSSKQCVAAPVPHVSFDRRTLQPKPAAQCGESRQKLPVIKGGHGKFHRNGGEAHHRLGMLQPWR